MLDFCAENGSERFVSKNVKLKILRKKGTDKNILLSIGTNTKEKFFYAL